MTLFPHTVAGCAVGAFMPTLGWSIVGGALSHLGLDFIPHWEPDISKTGFSKSKPVTKLFYGMLFLIDLSLSLLLLIIVHQNINMLSGGLAGILLDIDNFLQYKYESFPLLSKIGIPIHDEKSGWHGKTKFLPGMLTQIGVVVIGLWLLVTRLNFFQTLK